jgi:vancomycin resistance protein YoaR
VSVIHTVPQNNGRFPVRRLLAVSPLFLLAVGAAVVGTKAHLLQDQVASGVRVGDQDLGGKSLQEARAALQKWAEKRQSVSLTLRFAPETGIKRVWKASAQKLGLGLNVQATLDAAGRVGHDGVLGQVTQWVSGGKTVQVAASPTLEEPRLRAYLKQIGRMVGRKPKNAQLVMLAGGGFGIHHDLPGVGLDMDASVAAIRKAWGEVIAAPAENADANKPKPETLPAPPQNPDSPQNATSGTQDSSPEARRPSATAEGPDVTLAARTVKAAITTEDLKQVDGELGQPGGFSTYYTGTRNRRSNVALAASHINGTLLRPGEIFSYNRVVGPRDEDNGFAEAPQIVHGKMVPGIGGGVCQVSSTLFNAVLLSNLKIVERSHHAFPVHYLKPGRDATVVYGALDLKFQNSTSAPVYIVASAKGGRLTFRFFGKKAPGQKVTLERGSQSVQPASSVVERDPHLPAGRRIVKQPAHPGIRVTWYRVVREDGKVVSREPITTHYMPIPGIVVVGTHPKAPRAGKTLGPKPTVAPAPGGSPVAPAPATTTPPPGAQ